jgi:two-component system, OmpR family, copper resistance phosphate regulon response regulator CusR
MSRILIIEDDAKTAAAIAEGLALNGHESKIAETAEQGAMFVTQDPFDLLILDWMLPRQSGIEILKSLRRSNVRIPALLLTARDTVEDRVLGLDAGADDYLIKPFAFAELHARVRALLRRSIKEESLRHQVADLILDLEQRTAFRGPKLIALTPREFDVLWYLMRHAEEPVTRQMLAAQVWRDVPRATPLDNVIDVHLAHLRRKVDDGHAVKLIHTLRGIGFLCGEKARD